SESRRRPTSTTAKAAHTPSAPAPPSARYSVKRCPKPVLGLEGQLASRYNSADVSPEIETMSRNGPNGRAHRAPVHPRLGIPELAGVCSYEEVEQPGL